MKQLLATISFLLMISGCNDAPLHYDNDIRFLNLEDIKREYCIADSLNNLEDRSNIDTSDVILGVDKRNGKVVVKTCQTRGFGCMLFTDYYTIKYRDCDSVCCDKNGGVWLVDYVGFAGARSVVGCVPDTLP